MKLTILFFIVLPMAIFAQFWSGGEEDKKIINKSFFTVVAPNTIRRGRPFKIEISVRWRPPSIVITITFRIRIRGTTNSGKSLEIKKQAKISSPTTRTSLSIDTSDIPDGKYELYVETENFSEIRRLTYITKEYSFLLQLSKAIYLPGELVQFRVYAIDSETKAVNPTIPNIISITHANGNEITSFSNVTFNRGKHENSFRLSEKTSLGNWNLQFKFENEIISKEFEVAEYTLPLIQGSLSVLESTPFKFGRVPITVEISYTFGGAVSGTATVTIRRTRGNQIVMTRTVDVTSGSASFDAHMEDDLGIQPGQSAYFRASLVFEDPLTGNKVTDEKRFRVSPYTYNIHTISDSNIVPGTPFKFTITMKKYDGSPAPSGTSVEVIPQDISTIPSQTLTIGADGTVSSSVNVPVGTDYLSLLIKSKDSYDDYVSAGLVQYVSGSYMQIDVLTQTPRLGENVDLKIRTGETINFVMVHLVSKGILLKTSRVSFTSDNNEDNDPNTVVYSFKPSFKYAPMTKVIAYYIKENGDFVTAQAYIQLDKDLPNYLTISPATQEVKPAARIDLDIESYIGSRVSLVAMDQRSLLLKGGSNIVKEDVFSDLNQYSWSSVQYDWNYVANYEYAFGSAGLFVFTNIPRPKGIVWEEEPNRRPERPSKESKDSDVSEESGGNVNIRKDFREVFLWREVPIYGSASDFYGSCASDYDEWKGLETISVKVPESITTYLIYGVSMSKYDGIGLTDNIPSVTVFLPFFLSVELPYSVKRNEVLEQDIIIFNYLKRRQTVEVKIKKNAGFTHKLAKCGWRDIGGFYALNVTTKVGENIKLKFELTPKKLGLIPFEVTAKGPLAGDGILKQLRVIPEGIPRSITSSVFLALDKKTPTINTKLSCKLPNSAYQDTTEISTTVAGDIFGKALKNLNKLIVLPHGCPEQTMLTLAPMIAIYMYLLSSGMLTATLQGTLENYISAGYQNIVGYQQSDGSYLSSTWLTAYITQYFYFANSMVFIDSNTIKKGADFVRERQVTDTASVNFGSFEGPGYYYNMQERCGLTAYCAIMFSNILPGYQNVPEYITTHKDAITYLEKNCAASSSTYELGIIAYALQLAGSSKADEAYDLFFGRKTDLGSMMYWDVTSSTSSSSLDIEVTAYGLLNVIKHNENLNTVLKVVKYLVSQSNSFGGYSSSQDTVMAIYALSQFAKVFSLNRNAVITISPNVGNSVSATIDPKEVFNLQTFELNPATREIKIKAKTSDSGLAIVSLICNFYYDPKLAVPIFNIDYKFSYSCTSRITFEVCANLISKGSTNMAIMIVNMPSGFTYNEWQAQTNPDVSITEVTNQKSTVTFYFNSITQTKNCVNINAYRSKTVSALKPATIEVYDYYDTSKYGMTYYEVPDLSSSCYYKEYR